MRVNSFSLRVQVVELLALVILVKESDCFSILGNQAAEPFRFSDRLPAATSSAHQRTSKKHYPLQPNKSRHQFLASVTADDSSSAASVSKGRLADRIKEEFEIGCRGLDGEDGMRFLYPGIEAILAYPPAAQEAWINEVDLAREHHYPAHPHAPQYDLQYRHLQEDDNFRHHGDSRQERVSLISDEREESIANINNIATTTFFQRFKSKYLSKRSKRDGSFRQQLAKMGLSVAISYGFVSNLVGCSSIVLTWYIFSKKTGLSPLYPGQWKPFLAVYAGFYIFHNIVRPARFALSVALSPKIESLLEFVQQQWRVSNKGLAILIVMFSLNIVLCSGSMCAGILLASRLTGVPILPVK